MKKIYILPVAPSLLIAIILLSAANLSEAQTGASSNQAGSFMIMAGTSITEDGSVLIAHNHERKEERPFFLKKFPRTKHDSGSVILFPNGLKIAQSNITLEWMGLKDRQDYTKSGAVGINEQQVAIGGWVSLDQDRNMKARSADPLVKGGTPIGMVPVALQRSRSARELVKILGTFFNQYGIASSFGLAVADKREVWYLETGSGHHWAAVQVPPDACWVQSHSYRIGHIDPDDSGVLASPGIKEFAAENQLYNPESEIFHFAEAFGGRKQKSQSPGSFNSRRLWRGISMLETSLEVQPNQKGYPQFIRPENKVTLEKLISILRDHYQGSPYYIFGNDSLAGQAKPVASENTVYTNIVQLTDGMPSNIGAVLWAGLGSPNTTPYIPFYFGIKEIPKPYDAETRDPQRAYTTYKTLSERYFSRPDQYTDIFPDIWSDFQTKAIKQQINIDQGAMRLYRTDIRQAKHFITVNVEGLSQQALDIAQEQMDN
ncbi:MAG: C69 family dipeptidase [Bacteroidales bacterium]|nr:C69 family dipeptidase [Bacteroidales bacterium]